jgi:multidrug efflux pump subunit AcrA (membrane-fusion protein)
VRSKTKEGIIKPMFSHFINTTINASFFRRVLGSVALVVPIALTSAACKSGYPVSARNNPGAEGKEARQIKVAHVTEISMEQTVTVTGTLAAFDQATVSAKVPGRVKSISVDLGSVVAQGQIIAQIEQQDYQLRLKQSEAALAQARARVGLPPEGKDDR